jgi:hypothetical protein
MAAWLRAAFWLVDISVRGADRTSRVHEFSVSRSAVVSLETVRCPFAAAVRLIRRSWGNGEVMV